MTLYADSNFYTKEYLEGRDSVIELSCITSYLRKAQMFVKTFTFDNIDENSEIPYEVKMCICEIADIMYNEAQRETAVGGAVSESVEGWSKTYENSEEHKAAVNTKLKDCLVLWLSNTGLLYCGVTQC